MRAVGEHFLARLAARGSIGIHSGLHGGRCVAPELRQLLPAAAQLHPELQFGRRPLRRRRDDVDGRLFPPQFSIDERH